MSDDLERERLELDKQHLEFEIEKHKADVKLERIKALAIFIPLILIVITFYIDNHNNNENYKREMNIAQMEANSSFKLKVAEIIMGAEPTKTYKRALILQSIFPEYLDESFARGFNPKSVATPAKMDLAKLIIDHPSQRDEIINLWTSIYPGDTKWANKWKSNYNSSDEDESVIKIWIPEYRR